MASFYQDVANKDLDSRLAYKNTYYAMAIALETYLADTLLQGDLTRVIASSTDYALIKRSGTSTWNNASLPFINYKMSSKEPRGLRQWFSNEAYSQGVFLEELGVKARMVPVTFNIDCTFWTGRDDDWQYATDRILYEEAAETKIDYTLDFNGTLVKNLGIVKFNLNLSPTYQEKDWLEKNNILSFSINPAIQTFLLKTTTAGYCIPKTVLMNFLTKKKVDTGEITSYEQALNLTIDHINGSIVQN